MLRLVIGAVPGESGVRGVQILHRDVRVTRLAEGLAATGRISEVALERTAAGLAGFARRLAEFAPDRAAAVATGALRQAANAETALAALRAAAGPLLPIAPISGDREAALALRAIEAIAAAEVPVDEGLGVIDVGGASTEIVVRPPLRIRSLPIGVVTLTESGASTGPDAETRSRLRVRRELGALDPCAASPIHWYAAGGAALALAAFASGRPYLTFLGERATPFDRARLRATLVRFQALPSAVRAAQLAISEDHAALIPAGCWILDEIMAAMGAASIRPTGVGVAEGLLDELLASD